MNKNLNALGSFSNFNEIVKIISSLNQIEKIFLLCCKDFNKVYQSYRYLIYAISCICTNHNKDFTCCKDFTEIYNSYFIKEEISSRKKKLDNNYLFFIDVHKKFLKYNSNLSSDYEESEEFSEQLINKVVEEINTLINCLNFFGDVFLELFQNLKIEIKTFELEIVLKHIFTLEVYYNNIKNILDNDNDAFYSLKDFKKILPNIIEELKKEANNLK